MRYTFLIITQLVLFCGFASAQQIQLFSEDFETSPNLFTTNADTTGPGSPGLGANKWIINDAYNGQSIYPTTTRQDSTVSGTINNAPFSDYLHIHDSAATSQGVSNANFDPTDPSDNFAYISDGFCTLGLVDVKFTFFYLAEGGADAYGEVYYSRDNGPWQKVGQNKYNNQSKWKYKVLSDSNFSKATSLRFGFRWVNDSLNAQDTSISFAVDEIIAVGTYDDVNNPVDIQIDNIFPDTICPTENLFINYSLSEPLCEATYRIELSNSNGNFNNPTSLGIFDISSTDTSGAIAAEIPSNTSLGSCYKVRLTRVSPSPKITGSASACFVVEDCPNTVTTQEPVAVTGPDTICALSVIDVPFTSDGGFNSGNVYTAQLLTDSSGSLTAPQAIDTIGTFQSSENFTFPPGTVSGLVPDIPEGCDYYIRVNSSDPAVEGSTYGPFCIKRCNVYTNNAQSLSVCVTDTTGAQDTISYDVDFWGDSTDYYQGNSFEVQLLDKMGFSIVNTGGLGATVDTSSGNIIISVPSGNNLSSLGLQAGPYYLRVIADSATNPNDTLGTLVNITIGAPSSTPPDIIVDPDTVACNTGIVEFLISPYNQYSEYEWASDAINGGVPFTWPSNPLSVDFTGADVDDYTFVVTEINYGCRGPQTSAHTIDIISTPIVDINGPQEVCKGDTVDFNVPFIAATFYEWSTSRGQIIDTSNNELTVVYDSLGTANIQVDALNQCGSSTGNFTLQVKEFVDLDAGKDTTICKGNGAELTAESQGVPDTLATNFSDQLAGNGHMFDIRAKEDALITSFDGNMISGGNKMRIYYKEGTHVGYEQDSSAWTLVGSATGVPGNGIGNPAEIPIQINQTIKAGDTLAFYVTSTNGTFLSHTGGVAQGNLYSSDNVLEIYAGTENDYPFGNFTPSNTWDGIVHYISTAGLQYQWSNGDTTATTLVEPSSPTTYNIEVRDPTGCGTRDTVTVGVDAGPEVATSHDTSVCRADSVALSASGAQNYQWTPAEKLINANTANPIAYITEDDTFTVTGTNQRGCADRDSVQVKTIDWEDVSDTVTLCKGKTDTLALPGDDDASYGWQDGTTGRVREISEPGGYSATVTSNNKKCASFYTFYVAEEVCNSRIKVPEAFSPNGDGKNDYFAIFAEGIQEYEISIYNRWGERVYHSTDAGELNDMTSGWNGKHKGEKQNVGTYVYHIEAKDFDGNTITKKGNVTLVR